MPAESYIVPLKRAYDKPRTRRSNVAIKEVFDFLYKHTRKSKENIILSKEVNEYVWNRGIQKPPRKMAISIREKDGKVYVFLKDSKEIANFLNKDKEIKEKKSLKEKVAEMKENIQNPTTDKKDKKVEVKKNITQEKKKAPKLEKISDVKEEKAVDKKDVSTETKEDK